MGIMYLIICVVRYSFLFKNKIKALLNIKNGFVLQYTKIINMLFSNFDSCSTG